MMSTPKLPHSTSADRSTKVGTSRYIGLYYFPIHYRCMR